MPNATDPDFWSRFKLDLNQIQMVLLAMPNHRENLFAAGQIRAMGYAGRMAAVAKYADEITALRTAGVDAAYNLYQEAGVGLVEHIFRHTDEDPAGERQTVV